MIEASRMLEYFCTRSPRAKIKGFTMKKTVIALFAALALLLGSGALVSGASAAPYPNTVATKTSVSASGSVTEGKRLTVTVRVRAGNASVTTGNVKVIFGGRVYEGRVVKSYVKIKVKAPQVKKTMKKTLKVSYLPASNSVYKASDTSKQIKVKNKKSKKRR